MATAPVFIGVGGSIGSGGTTELALKRALELARDAGADTELFSGRELELPAYAWGSIRSPAANRLLRLLRQADGVILASPAYHGSLSGLVKNVLDYVQDLHEDAAPYFEGRVVGCVVVAGGWQGGVATLSTLRNVVHALRGWPTPMGLVVNTSEGGLDAKGRFAADGAEQRCRIMVDQMMTFVSSAAAHQAVHEPLTEIPGDSPAAAA